MPDWTKSMEQYFEYYIVDPVSFQDKEKIDFVRSASLTGELSSDTKGYAQFDIDQNIGEAYVRVYLVTIQNGIKESTPLGTYLVQTPSTSFDGKVNTNTIDGYTPLIELKEKLPPIGYTCLRQVNIMYRAWNLVKDNVRAPVIKPAYSGDDAVYTQSFFAANTSDTWLSFVSDFIAVADYDFRVDPLGKILFAKNVDASSMQPVWTYSDDENSIICPELTYNHDIFGIPNVVEVIYTSNSGTMKARVTNNQKNSPLSIVNRGREIVYRDTQPNIIGVPTQAYLNDYAKSLLRSLSSVEYELNYTHGYCPVKVGDCVRIDYAAAGLTGINAKVTKQTIKCETGCLVDETAVFTVPLWG